MTDNYYNAAGQQVIQVQSDPAAPLKTSGAHLAKLPDGKSIGQVGTTSSKFTDGFNGAALDLDKWDVVRDIGGMALAVTNGALVVSMGVNANAELLLVGKQDCTIPCDMTIVLQMSQRLGPTNNFRFGYIEVEPGTGSPVNHAVPALGFRNFGMKTFTGSGTGVAALDSMSSDAAAVLSVVETISGANVLADQTIKLRPEDMYGLSQLANSTAVRGAGGARLSSQVPSPNRVYRPALWFRNIGVPTSNTNVTISRLVSVDKQEVEVQPSMGEGNNLPSQAIPVVIAASGVATAVAVTGAVVVSGSAASAANGAIPAKVNSAATPNYTLLKGAVGRLMGGALYNSGPLAYLKLFNKATAPTGADTPTAMIPLKQDATTEFGAIFDMLGISFATGIGYALVTGAADNDATAVAAGQITGTLLYA